MHATLVGLAAGAALLAGVIGASDARAHLPDECWVHIDRLRAANADLSDRSAAVKPENSRIIQGLEAIKRARTTDEALDRVFVLLSALPDFATRLADQQQAMSGFIRATTSAVTCIGGNEDLLTEARE